MAPRRTPRSGIAAGEVSQAIQVLSRVTASHPFPIGIVLALTERCNLRCGHCLLSPAPPEERLDRASLEPVLHELASLGVLFLTITGGEPTLRGDLVELVRLAAERRFSVRLKTNATLLDESRVIALHAAGLHGMDVSVYHPQAGRHDAFVGLAGAHARLTAAARAFRTLGGQVHVSCNVMEWNADAIEPLLDWCEGERFTFAIDPCVTCGNDGALAPTRLRAADEPLRRLVANPTFFAPRRGATGRPVALDRPLCGAGLDGPYLAPDGELRLCVRLPYTLGNVLRSPFRELWLDSATRAWFRGLTWNDLGECRACSLASECYRCPATALLEHGDLLGRSDTDCRLARLLAERPAAPPEGDGGPEGP